MKKGKVRYWIALSTGLLLCASHGPAWAQTALDKADADALFNEGKQLVNKPDDAAAWALACEKFEASLAKVTRLGTQIALATCYEKLGKTASAWEAFRAAVSAAGKAHDKRQQFAEQHAAALEAKLSKIIITIDAAHRIDGLEVQRDGVAVTSAMFGSAVPVDPGEHTVNAIAPGRVAWSTKVSLPETPGTVEVSVPALGKVPEPSRPHRHRSTIAYAIGGGGIAIVVTSLIVGGVARSRWEDAQSHCNGDHRRCDQLGVDLARRARTLGNISTATFVVGTVAVATGVVFFLAAPSMGAEHAQPSNPMAIHLIPDIGPTQVGLMLQGGF